MPKKLYVAWQDSNTRRWFPIGTLNHLDGGEYTFAYTQGVFQAQKESQFDGLQSFPDLHKKYSSRTLFPVFQNRILSPGRPEYDDFITWLNLSGDASPIAILARTGGRRETDALEVFPCPSRTKDGKYVASFFAHGIRHLVGAAEIVQRLKTGDRLEMVHDSNNKYDSMALRLERALVSIGYCPRYVTNDFHKLLKVSDVQVQVELLNPDPVPIQFRLLCQFSCSWPDNFLPFDYDEYEPVKDQSAPVSRISAKVAT
jgi:hypothetical protein